MNQVACPCLSCQLSGCTAMEKLVVEYWPLAMAGSMEAVAGGAPQPAIEVGETQRGVRPSR